MKTKTKLEETKKLQNLETQILDALKEKDSEESQVETVTLWLLMLIEE